MQHNLMRRIFPLAVTAVAAMLASGAALAQEVVKIGYTGPLSGGAALYGKNVLSGVQMAVDEINASGLEVKGKKVKLEVVALDDKYSPAEAAINGRRLVQQHKTPAVFVPHSGGIFALQAFNEQEKFLVMAYSSVPRITDAGNKLTIRIPPAYTGYIEPFIKAQMKRYGKNVALAPADHDYAKAWVQAFLPAWEAAGGKVVANNPMSYTKATDFYSGVSRAISEKPDVMFVGGPSEPTALVVKQARELGFKGGFIVMDQAKMDEMARVTNGLGMLEGSIGVLPLVNDSRPATQAFNARYKKLHDGRDATTEMSLNYTMVYALAGAMKLAGTTSDAAAIRAKMPDAVKGLAKEVNPNEVDGIDAKGGSMADTVVGWVQNGKISQVRLSELAK
ncbi:high-affinity branched-chain amino acid transport protein, ligand-binding receptor [Cupriavidus taiwanensis]|uniref:High-affinity branched-chain amino acid transport protein, ligand-binding receptor n=1 Tax=Cupriavidus taiwanensis TaxID=164546 RepID=A0A375D2D2_9BURK|nr:ABC transporter substrate-binding protein [Cupriavidus taiwanensis]SOY92556.1 high-affinity branched-chain amino acid transport protein, ligand-binding receptor [Cupriavidus taiwanensis]SOY97170.1 high-affinity branched-chain amino acid transport protein, ligand-binding receptor [Cupriavidus taiwanensis]SPA32433.1 high-affinity branched-chain amino acid transport protein, ligand-binding receptor [Cupriavidus taiwanensis]SPA56887.1 high-affinity branched-chain amino acid transport protein, li